MNNKSIAKNELNKCKDEINRLRRALNQLDEQKESWFKKIGSLSKQISKLIGKVKSNKGSRDKFTKEVKTTKVKRQKINVQIRAKIEEFKKLDKEKQEVQKKFGITEDHSMYLLPADCEGEIGFFSSSNVDNQTSMGGFIQGTTAPLSSENYRSYS